MNQPSPAPAVTRYWGTLLLILCAALIVRGIHFSIAQGSDDQVWIKVAQEVSKHAPLTDHPVYYTRLVWTWLLIVWGVFGSLSLQWSAVFMFALSALTTVLIAEATRRAFDARAGLLAAVVYGFHPLAVMYDTVTLPDGPAVTALAACMLLFISYLRSASRVQLLGLGLLIGFLFGIKNYFMLVSLPCALVLFLRPEPLGTRIKQIGMLAGASVVGLVLTFGVGAISGIGASSHLVATGEYAAYISQDDGPTEGYAGWRQLAATLIERTDYTVELFFSLGTVMGFVTLWGTLLFLLRWRRNSDCLFVCTTLVLFFLFLTFMPIRFSPLLFTQMHQRYLTALLPPLSIAGGVALAELWGLLRQGGPALRRSTLAIFACLLVFCACVPNGMHDRYRVIEMRGLDRALTQASALGVRSMTLPAVYQRQVPDSYLQRDVQVNFRPLDSATDAAAATELLAADPSAAVMVFRTPYRTLKEKLRTGDYSDALAYGPATALMNRAHEEQLEIIEVRAPYDSFRVWLSRAGIDTRGQLIGWMIRQHRT